MVSETLIQDEIKSFNDCWKAYRKQLRSWCSQDNVLERNAGLGMGDAQNALVKRFNRIKDRVSSERISQDVDESINLLANQSSLDVLSDSQMSEFKAAARLAEKRIDSWMESMLRTVSYQANIAKKRQKQWMHRLVTVPMIFLIISGALVFVGIRIFLNR